MEVIAWSERERSRPFWQVKQGFRLKWPDWEWRSSASEMRIVGWIEQREADWYVPQYLDVSGHDEMVIRRLPGQRGFDDAMRSVMENFLRRAAGTTFAGVTYGAEEKVTFLRD
jgi:hypothetical protein